MTSYSRSVRSIWNFLHMARFSAWNSFIFRTQTKFWLTQAIWVAECTEEVSLYTVLSFIRLQCLKKFPPFFLSFRRGWCSCGGHRLLHLEGWLCRRRHTKSKKSYYIGWFLGIALSQTVRMHPILRNHRHVHALGTCTCGTGVIMCYCWFFPISFWFRFLNIKSKIILSFLT